MNTKKLIGTSMIALLVIALSVGMVAAADPKIDASDADGFDREEFNIGETVYAEGDVERTGDPGAARIYVVLDDTHRTWSYGEDIAANADRVLFYLSDVDPADVDKDQNGPLAVGLVVDKALDDLVGMEIAAHYEYDIIWDGNGNGIYEPQDSNHQDGIDCMDHTGCRGFAAVPEFATIAIPAIALLGLVLYMRRKKD